MPAPQFYNNNQQQQSQSHQRYIPTSEAYLTRRIGEAVELEPSLRRPPDGKVSNSINPPNYHYNQQYPPPTPLKLQAQRQYQNSPREVSETDLYLLGAIEKLVYRVDYMEKRLKRTEQLVYYLMQGNNQKPEVEQCPTNFTKIGENCFYFSSSERVDWKTAAGKCKSLGSSLAEFDKIEKFRDVVGHVLNSQGHRGHDFWIGGLNPGKNDLKSSNFSSRFTSFQVSCGFGQHQHDLSTPTPISHLWAVKTKQPTKCQ